VRKSNGQEARSSWHNCEEILVREGFTFYSPLEGHGSAPGDFARDVCAGQEVQPPHSRISTEWVCVLSNTESRLFVLWQAMVNARVMVNPFPSKVDYYGFLWIDVGLIAPLVHCWYERLELHSLTLGPRHQPRTSDDSPSSCRFGWSRETCLACWRGRWLSVLFWRKWQDFQDAGLHLWIMWSDAGIAKSLTSVESPRFWCVWSVMAIRGKGLTEDRSTVLS
jgi:hypothetical protein